MTHPSPRSLSLRARITLIVVLGAITPLALIGTWLAESTARSGRQLLRSELDSSLAEIAQRVADRWQYRAADLALLANNASARVVLSSRTLDEADVRYLTDLATELRASIREFTYRDSSGRTRWSSSDISRPIAGEPVSERRVLVGFGDEDAVPVRLAVVSETGRRIGTLEARILLSAILPTDSLRFIVAGAALRMRNRELGESIGGRQRDRAGSTVSSRRSLDEPPFDLELIASDARYVEPFKRAARLGLLLLLGVAVVVAVLTAFMMRRVTASLEEMADAAGAIAGGELERVVVGEGADEIARLALAFNSMTTSLRATLQELANRESLAAVGQFAAALAHEVRNALTSIRLDVQRLQDRDGRAELDRALMERVLRNVRRLDSIVTGSLRIARTRPENMRPVALEGVLRAALTSVEAVFLENGCRTALELDEGRDIRVRADAAALEQLFINLLMNAAQAMKPGGVARVTVHQSNSRIAVRISDSGHGMSPETLARLGRPLFSLKATGTGLGFAIAKQIAISHGGEVSVAATGPAGTTVEVALPYDSLAGIGKPGPAIPRMLQAAE